MTYFKNKVFGFLCILSLPQKCRFMLASAKHELELRFVSARLIQMSIVLVLEVPLDKTVHQEVFDGRFWTNGQQKGKKGIDKNR